MVEVEKINQPQLHLLYRNRSVTMLGWMTNSFHWPRAFQYFELKIRLRLDIDLFETKNI